MIPYILIAIVMTLGSSTSITQEFHSQQSCETAKESIRQKLSTGTFILLSCEKK